MTKLNDIIKETLNFKDLTPEEKDKRHILGRLYGPVADFKNATRNGRKYSEQLWEKVFNSKIMLEKIKNGVCYGELGHPEDRTEIDLNQVAVVMPEVPKKDKEGHLIAYFDILDTPAGKILKTLCDYGSTLGVSSRGTGDLEEDEYGNESVNPDTYECECFDIVVVPAVESARLKFTENLNTKPVKTLKQALCESLESASDEDKVAMKETLDRLDIKLDEAEDAEADAVEPSAEEPVELTYDDKIKQLFALTKGDDKEATEEEVENFVSAFKAIFPEECYNPEGCADKDEEDNAIPDDETAVDDGAELLVVDSLKEALRDKSELEAKVKSLQEQLAVSDAKAVELEDKLHTEQSVVKRLTSVARERKALSSEVSSLKESMNEKETTIKNLKEEISKKNQVVVDDKKVKELSENLRTLKEGHEKEIQALKESHEKELKDTTALNEQLKKDLASSKQMTEGYKTVANKAVNKYIALRAKNLGVKPVEIVSKLPQSYNLSDVDRICEGLSNYHYNVSKISTNLSNQGKIKVATSQPQIDYINDDDDVSNIVL